MFFRILKNDLKRKRTMNIIILLFVMLATMFVASSVNNILTVMNGLDYYFNKAGLDCDYIILSRTVGESTTMEELLDSEPSVTSYRVEPQIMATSSNFSSDGEKIFDYNNMGLIFSIADAQLNYLDEKNDVITDLKEGEVYITGKPMRVSGLKAGDTIELTHSGTTLTLTVAGEGKDALLGSDFMSNPRFIIHPKDYETLLKNDTIRQHYSANIYYISTDDVDALKEALSDESGILFDADLALIRMTYVMNLIVAGILLVVSVGLILVSFTVLRFTIGFTIAEEFREIGVMKAMGMKNFAIRRLYLTKYLGIAVLGAAIGFLGSIPFGAMLLKSVSENIVLGNDNSLPVSLLCTFAVVFITLLFSCSCTRKVNRLSPVDAVRNGQTGERFGRKGILHLGKSHLKTTGFLAINDVLSSPKQFGIITAVFSICLLMVMLLANTANTLCSDRMLPLLGTTYSDVYYSDTDSAAQMMGYEGDDIVYEELQKTESILAGHGMPAECLIEVQYKYSMSFHGKSIKLSFQQGKGTHADEYVYNEGSAPQSENEIALTPQAAALVGAQIGDTVQIDIGGEEKDYLITAYFSTFNNMGECGRLHENVKTDMAQSSGVLSKQINFTDHPDRAEIDRRIEKMKELFDTEKVYDAASYANVSTGASDTIRGIEYLILLITMIITALVTVLMERSFITKETSEIALMKAMGFRDGKIMAQHTLRFVLVVILSALIAAALNIPLTKLCVDPIFHLMGTAYGITYEIRPLEIFAVYPAIFLIITVLSAYFTSLYTKTITASQTSNIE